MAERGVDEALLAAVVQHGDDTAGSAALEVLLGLHDEAEPVGFMLRRQTRTPGTPNITAAVGQPSLQSTSSRPSRIRLLGRS